MPGVAVIKCCLCERKGPLLRGGEKAVTTWLKGHGWRRPKKYGLVCPRCVRGLKEDESDLDRCGRKTRRMSAEAKASQVVSKSKKQKRCRTPRVEVLTTTHLPAKFHTGQHVEWDARELGLGWRTAEIIGVRDKLGHYRYKIRLDVTVKSLLAEMGLPHRSKRLSEIDVPEKALRVPEGVTCPRA